MGELGHMRSRRPWWVVWALLVGLAWVPTRALLLGHQGLWSTGFGVLRNTRRLFWRLPGGDYVCSWDGLSAFLVVGALALATVWESKRSLASAALILLLAASNDWRALVFLWSVAVATWVWRENHCHQAAGQLLAGVMGLGLALSPLSPVSPRHILTTPMGQGGILDAPALGMVRHLLSTKAGGHQVDLSFLPPSLALAAAVVAAAAAHTHVVPHVMLAGALVLLKLLPLVATKVGAGSISSAVAPGVIALGASWAGLWGSRTREALLSLGGAQVFLGLERPVEAATWVAARAVAATGAGWTAWVGIGCSVLVAATCAAAVPGQGGMALSGLMAAGALVTLPRAQPLPPTSGIGLTLILASSVVPPLSGALWRTLTFKLTPAVPTGHGIVSAVAGALAGLGLVAVGGSRWAGWLEGSGRKWGKVAERLGSGIALALDAVAVTWVAAERFVWQGVTLWLPRRLAAWAGLQATWFQRVVISEIGQIPSGAMGLLTVPVRLALTPGGFALILACALALVWLG